MLDTLLTFLNEGSRYYGLELCEVSEGFMYHLVEVRRKKQELFIVREDSFADFDVLANALQQGIPLFFVINTAQVLSKISEVGNGANNYEALVHQAFPNLNFDAFYYEGTRVKNQLLMAICKNENVAAQLEKFAVLNLDIVNFSLGITAIANSACYLPDGTLSLSNRYLLIKEGSIDKIVPFDQDDFGIVEEYDLNGLTVHSPYILSFSTVLGHLLKSTGFIGNFRAARTNLKREFTNRRHFNLLLRSSLAFVLALLLVNFLIFDHYYRTVDVLRDSLTVNGVQHRQLLQLKTAVANKENRLNAVLGMSNSTTSFFLDEIAKDIPSSILLTKVQYQPLERPIRDDKPLKLLINTIVIAGQAMDSGHFYSWIETMEKSSWISHIETTDYDYEGKNTSIFSLKIYLDED